MDSQKQNLCQRLETIQEADEYSGSRISAEVEHDAEMKELEESVGLEEETEQLLEQGAEEREEQEEEVQTPPSVRAGSRPKRSRSSLPRTKSRVNNQADESQRKVRRKRRRSAKVKLQEDLVPDWVVQLMFNIEEATRHALVVESNGKSG